MAGWIVAVLVVLLIAQSAVRKVGRQERGVVFRLGKALDRTRRPGWTPVIPFVDRLVRVDLSDRTVVLPYQGPTRDGRKVRIEAALTYRVTDPLAATLNVRNHGMAIAQLGLVVLRTAAERHDYDELTTSRGELRHSLLHEVRPAAADWGVELAHVEVRGVGPAVPSEPSAPEPTAG
ncbi:SPFH domain-containing protein [Kitasatospora sp. NPDC088391]|uniref:SPFH domain-containing protein n=1 Tax=Kitasatospora sp. NPDC088391 TaxID=3364074 RepID=UPI0038279044